MDDAQELKTRQYQNKLGKNDGSNLQDLEKLNLAAAVRESAIIGQKMVIAVRWSNWYLLTIINHSKYMEVLYQEINNFISYVKDTNIRAKNGNK